MLFLVGKEPNPRVKAKAVVEKEPNRPEKGVSPRPMPRLPLRLPFPLRL